MYIRDKQVFFFFSSVKYQIVFLGFQVILYSLWQQHDSAVVQILAADDVEKKGRNGASVKFHLQHWVVNVRFVLRFDKPWMM